MKLDDHTECAYPFDFQAGVHARIQIYWCRSSIFRHLKLELLTQFPASNDEKYINVVYIWRKFVSFYGYVHWRMTTEISVMYGSEKVMVVIQRWYSSARGEHPSLRHPHPESQIKWALSSIYCPPIKITYLTPPRMEGNCIDLSGKRGKMSISAQGLRELQSFIRKW